MAIHTGLLAIQLQGNPQNVANPQVLALHTADVTDNGGDTYMGADLSDQEMEQMTLEFSNTGFEALINGIGYNDVYEVDSGSLQFDGVDVQGFFVSLYDSTLSVEGFYFFPLATQDVSHINVGSTVTATNQADTGDTINMVYSDIMLASAVVCFANGTMISTFNGLVPVENLTQGDLVWTLDHGYQPIRWIGAKFVPNALMQANPKLRPLRIRQGAIRSNVPSRDLVVSQQHRIFVKSSICERLSDTPEALVPAKQLLEMNGFDVADDLESVTYYHFIFDKHEVVLADGALTESFFPGPQALKALSADAREELFTLFPELMNMSGTGAASAAGTTQPARPILGNPDARKLASRHLKNHQDLVN